MIIQVGRYDSYVVLNKKQIAICFAPRIYEIKEAIAELRRTKQLPSKNAGYKPNYEAIRNVYAINVARLLKLEYEKGKNKVDATAPDDACAINTNINIDNIMTKLPIDIVSNLYVDMLKEIILCDYNHVLWDYNINTDDGELLSLSATKGRKKVRMLLTKVEEKKTLFFAGWSFQAHNSIPSYNRAKKIHYDPDDDYEEREERRILKQREIEGLRMFLTDPGLAKQYEEQHEIDRQIGSSIYSLLNKEDEN